MEWPKLIFSPSTAESNYMSWRRRLHDTICANFGYEFGVITRNDKAYTPSMPSLPTMDDIEEEIEEDVREEFLTTLRKAVTSTYATDIAKAKTTNSKLFGIIWACLSTESRYAIERLPEWTNQEEDRTSHSTYNLEALMQAITKTHMVQPSGPRRNAHDIFLATESYHSLRMGLKQSLSEYMEEFKFARSRIEGMGGVLEIESQSAMRFLKSLDPDRFSEFVTALNTSCTIGGNKFPSTIFEVFSLAYDASVTKASMSKTTSMMEATTLTTIGNPTETSKQHPKGNRNKKRKPFKGSKPSSTPSKPSSNQRQHSAQSNNKIKCHFCDRIGHVIKDCRKYIAAKDAAKQKTNERQGDNGNRARSKPHKPNGGPPRPKRPQHNNSIDNANALSIKASPAIFPRNIDSEDDFEDDAASTTSRSCFMMSEDTGSIPESHVLLDYQSGVNIIKDRLLLTNIRSAPTPMSITGIADGKSIVCTEIGDLKYFGECYYHENATANVLCAAKVEDMFIGKIKYKQQCYFRVTVEPDVVIEFKRIGSHYACPSSDLLPTHDQISTQTRALSVLNQLPKAKLKRIHEVLRVQRNLGYPALSTLKNIIRNNLISNLTIKIEDIDDTIAHIGTKTPEELKGKVSPPSKPIVKEVKIPKDSKDIELHIDLFFFFSLVYLICVSKPICYTTILPLGNKRWEEIGKALMSIINGYKSRQLRVTTVVSDNESSLVSSKEKLEGQGIFVNLVAPETHVPKAESKIRFVRERARTLLHRVGYKPPEMAIPWLLKFVAYSLNILPDTRTGLIPMEQLTGVRIDFARDARLCWGDIVEVFRTPLVLNSMDSRSFTCIALAPSGNSSGTWCFLSLASQRVIKSDKWTLRKYDSITMNDLLPLRSNQYRRLRDLPPEPEDNKSSISRKPERIKRKHAQDPIIEDDQDLNEITIPSEPLILKNEEPDFESLIRPGPDDQASQHPNPTSKRRRSDDVPPNEPPIRYSQPSTSPPTWSELVKAGQYDLGESYATKCDPSEILSAINATCEVLRTMSFNISVKEAYKRFPLLADKAIEAELKQMIKKKVFHPVHRRDIPKGSRHSRIYSSMFLK